MEASLNKKVFSTNKKGWIRLLRPSPELWTWGGLQHQTQIIYTVDISFIMFNLDLRPGSIVIESGTGSGSLTLSLARTVAPTGHVYTFEFHPQRAKIAEELFKRAGEEETITVVHRDVVEGGFARPEKAEEKEVEYAQAAMIDLPAPWAVIEKVSSVLVPGGRFCGFSPCIEQVQLTCSALRNVGFVDVTMKECLARPYHPVRTEFSDYPPPVSSKQSKKRKTPERSEEKDEQIEEKQEVNQKDVEEQVQEPRQAGETKEVKKKVSLLQAVPDIRGHTSYLCFATKALA
eukprot:TRINITY_DN3150_c0_g1_i2.p1 TRINITY_DN3150_c0_g1~~TRINITY_DN3150_c0_g1_i2.p1  ORF type:complete len:289 (+),score=67.31 TRINITY_DN3150_c0_g1_i2:185-1051(+)